MNNIKLLELYNQFNKIHNQFTAVKRQLVNTDYEEPLYPAEMQVLCLIESHPDYSISDISKSLYMSKSAASQLVSKLCHKNFMEKKRDPTNERFTILELNAKGHEAVAKFLCNESYTFGELIQFMNTYSNNDLDVIGDFLTQLERMFDKKLD